MVELEMLPNLYPKRFYINLPNKWLNKFVAVVVGVVVVVIVEVVVVSARNTQKCQLNTFSSCQLYKSKFRYQNEILLS